MVTFRSSRRFYVDGRLIVNQHVLAGATPTVPDLRRLVHPRLCRDAVDTLIETLAARSDDKLTHTATTRHQIQSPSTRIVNFKRTLFFSNV
jgi:hypothetical protein